MSAAGGHHDHASSNESFWICTHVCRDVNMQPQNQVQSFIFSGDDGHSNEVAFCHLLDVFSLLSSHWTHSVLRFCLNCGALTQRAQES